MTVNTGYRNIGFLSEECCKGELAQQVRDSGYYKVCCELNELAQTVLNHCHIHPDDEKEVYLTLHFQRMLSNFQSILIMAERGMLHQVEIMSRATLELFFNLVAYHLHDDFLDAMIIGDDDQRRVVIGKLYQAQQVSPTFTEAEMAQLKQIINSADEIDRDDIKVFMKAELAGLLNEYRTTYQLLSETVHSSLHSLGADLEIDKNMGTIIGINTCAEHADKLASLLMTTGDYVLEAVNIMLKLHKQPEQQTRLEQVKLHAQEEWKHIVVKVTHRGNQH